MTDTLKAQFYMIDLAIAFKAIALLCDNVSASDEVNAQDFSEVVGWIAHKAGITLGDLREVLQD
jgi:hypothetical protein